MRAGFDSAWVHARTSAADVGTYSDILGHDEHVAKEWWPRALGVDSGSDLPGLDALAAGNAPLDGVLRAAGMDARRARRLSAALGSLREHYAAWQLVDMAIECALGVNGPICAPDAPYPFRPDLEGQWYQWAEDGGAAIHRMNLAHDVRPADVPPPPAPPGGAATTLLVYHATAWRSAHSIAADGILREKGRRCLDFGVRPGFYVTPVLRDALEWARKSRGRCGRECAIVVFRLHADLTNARGPMNVVAFEAPTREWQRLTTVSRRCAVQRCRPLDDADMVVGPMVANPALVREGREAPRVHTPPRMQLASKSDRGDAALDAALAGILYVRKSR